MASVNKVILIGNLTRDVQSRHLPSGGMVAEFGMAMNRKWKADGGEEREEVCFVDCAAFGRQAEVIAKYCAKGKSLYVEGRLRYEQWDDKNGNGKRSKVTVTVENFQFIGGRDEGGGTPAPVARPAPATIGQGAREKIQNRPPAPDPFTGKDEFQEADIPF